MIGVKSKKETIVSRYDGQDYKFEPGVTVAISEDAATHIFGYGLDDKSRALIRLGWVQNSTAIDEAMKRLDDVQFLAEGKVVFEEPVEIGAEIASPPGKPTLHLPKAEAAGKK